MTKTIIIQEQTSKKIHKVTIPCVIGREAEAGLSISIQPFLIAMPLDREIVEKFMQYCVETQEKHA